MKDFTVDMSSDFDLVMVNGDFKISESTLQNQALLILTEKGELREFPTRGVGAKSWIMDDYSVGDFNGAVKREFELDGMKVDAIKGNINNLQIQATYV